MKNVNSMLNTDKTKFIPQETPLNLRPYNLKELSVIYGISSKTFAKWLKPFEQQIGKRNGYYFSIAQVREIFRILECPSVIYEQGKENR